MRSNGLYQHCEHYAISNDFFAQCGIIHHTRSVLDNRFCGRVFVLNKTPGFLFNDHYLTALFPSPSQILAGKGSVLDAIVSVDISTAEKREFTAQGVSMPIKHGHRNSLTGSGSNSPSGKEKEALKRASWGSAGVFGTGMDSVGQARDSAREAEGKTVKQLSRLWRYVAGQSPVGEGVGISNGVGLNGMMTQS